MVYENVKLLCKKNNISVQQLEKECGIGNGTIGKWKSRSPFPRVDALLKIAAHFGVTVNDLLKEESEA